MTITASIVLITLGAILRFAIDATVRGIDVATIGLILLIVGFIGLVIGLVRGYPYRAGPYDY